MKTGVASAITLSAILIATAAWFRFSDQPVQTPELVAVENFDVSEWYFQEAVKDFTNPTTIGAASGTEYEPLTPTEIAGRQLIVDYVGLAASGNANPSSIQALAEGQVENLIGLHKFEKVNVNEILVVQNSSTNAKNYAEEVSRIYENYAKQMETISKNIDASSAISGSFTLFTSPAGKVYEEMAASLKNTKVPSSIAYLHIELTNNALSNAAAMKAMSNVENDPVGVLAGLVALRRNASSETFVLEQIRSVLGKQM